MVDEFTSDNFSSQSGPASNEAQSSTIQSSPSQEQTSPRVFSQDDVNRLIGKTKAETRDRVRSEYENQMQNQSLGGMNRMSEEDLNSKVEAQVRKMASEMQEAAYKKAQEEQANGVIGQFFDRISNAKEKYQDFEDKVLALDLQHVPNLLPLSNSVDNTTDVMYELANNPAKAYQLHEIANKNPQLAFKMISELSNSIKQNEHALSARKPSEPLSQLKPSITPTDSGAMRVADWQKMSFLRG